MRRLRMGRRIAKLAMARRSHERDLLHPMSRALVILIATRSPLLEQDGEPRVAWGRHSVCGQDLRAAAVEDRIVETTTICPPLVEYDPDFLAQAADEISALPETSKLIRLAHDYGTLRAMIRQC